MSGPVRLRQFVVEAEVPEQCPRRVPGDAGGPRICPFTLCRHHRLLPSSRGPVKAPRIAPGDDTCALDRAARGGATEQEIGTWLGVSQPTVHNAIKRAVRKLARALALSPAQFERLLRGP